MVKFKLNEAYVEEVSGTPQNRSVWDMLLPRMPSIFSHRMSLRGDLFSGGSLVRFSGAHANDTGLIVGAGFVEVRNPMNYGLKGGFPVRNTEVMTEIYSISMFHQIYCLVRQLLIPVQRTPLMYCLSAFLTVLTAVTVDAQRGLRSRRRREQKQSGGK